MSQPVKQCTFTGGEIGPQLFARTDHALYDKSVRTLRNLIPMRHGGATGRPGTLYVGTALNGGNQVRLIPFIFNETGAGQSYMLEFGNLYIAFYQNGGNVVSSTKTITGATQANPCVITANGHGFSNGDKIIISGVLGMTQLDNAYFIVQNVTTNTFSLTDLLGNAINSTTYGAYTSGGTASKIYLVTTTYAQADLAALKFAESADVITIVHPNYAPAELSRIAATNWSLANITFTPPAGPVNPTSTGGPATTNTTRYYVSAVLPSGEETGATAANLLTNIGPATTASPITTSWTAAPSAVYYRVYSQANSSGVGFVGVSNSTTFIDTGFTPDYAQSTPVAMTVFGGSGDYPSTVSFVQQRRCFGNTNNNPIGCWMSQPGSFTNFLVSIPSKDGDAVQFNIAGEEVNAIQHILELKFMLLLTAGAEIYVQGDGTGVVKPSAINASTQSQYGSSSLKPLKVGDILIFNQALGSFVRDFAFDFSIDGYRGNDLTVFASHLFEGFSLSDWAFQKTPDSLVWAVRSDGMLLSCTYVREQQVLAWAHHDFTNGAVENVCAIPENGAYALYLSIKRVINGTTVRYIERMSSRIWTDEINSSYLDCFSTYNGTNAGSTTMTLLTPAAGFSTGDTAYQQQITLQASAGFFTAAMVGDQIVLSDAAYTASIGTQTPDGSLAFLGPAGNQIRCTIQAFISSTQVTVTPSGLVPSTLQNTPITGWSRAVSTVSGLGYLTGQQVSVWADRFVVGSPLNYHIPTVYTVPASGTLTLDKPYSVIYIGLPMIQDLQPLDLESYFGETMLARRKRVGRVSVYAYNTRSFFCGSEDPDTNNQNVHGVTLFQMFEERKGENQITYDEPPVLWTDQDYVITPARWNKNGRFFIRNVDPSPLTILAISPTEEDPVQGTYKRV